MLAAQEDRAQVDALHALPGLELGVEDGRVVVGGDPGVVEEHVDAAEALAGLGVQGADGALVGDVGDDGVVDLRRGADVDPDHPRALGAQAGARRRADAARGARDDGDLAVHAPGHQLPSVAMKIVLTSV